LTLASASQGMVDLPWKGRG